MTSKRFTVDDGLEDVLCWEINDKENENMTCGECVKLLNELHQENRSLKFQLDECRNHKLFSRRELEKENEQLKQTISKIDFAIISKYDNSLENLLDEVYDGEYNNWIQKQVLRAKKLEKGDVE